MVQKKKNKWMALLKMFMPPYLHSTVCLSIIYVTETVAYFSSTTFFPALLKVYGMDPYFTSFIGYLGQLPGIMLMSIIVEWNGVGRLNSLRFFTLMTLCSFLALAFIQNAAVIAVSTILVYFSMVPIISLLFTYISEIYPTEIRTFALGYYNNLSALFGIFLPYVAGYLMEVKIHWLFPVVWAGVFLFQLIVSLFLNVETLRRNLLDNVATR